MGSKISFFVSMDTCVVGEVIMCVHVYSCVCRGHKSVLGIPLLVLPIMTFDTVPPTRPEAI